MNICITTFMFGLLLGLGNVLLFVQPMYYGLIPIMFLYLCIGKKIYVESNCKSLEIKDFIFTSVFIMISVYYCAFFKISYRLSELSFLSLITFITVNMYANNIRFKSLLS